MDNKTKHRKLTI